MEHSPWHVGMKPGPIVYDAGGAQVADCRFDQGPSQARLVAAAPELMKACEAIALLSEGEGRRNMIEVAGMARAAIAKAKGA